MALWAGVEHNFRINNEKDFLLINNAGPIVVLAKVIPPKYHR